MADALASGASVRKDVGVQVPPRARCTMWIDNADGIHVVGGKKTMAGIHTCNERIVRKVHENSKNFNLQVVGY